MTVNVTTLNTTSAVRSTYQYPVPRRSSASSVSTARQGKMKVKIQLPAASASKKTSKNS